MAYYRKTTARRQRILETLQRQPEGRAQIRALRLALGIPDWQMGRDLTELQIGGHIRRYIETVEGQAGGDKRVQATWIPCTTCGGSGEVDGVGDAFGNHVPVPCPSCENGYVRTVA